MLIGHQSKFLKRAFLALALVKENRDIFFRMRYTYRKIEISCWWEDGNVKKKNVNKLAKWKAFGLAGGMKSAEIFFCWVVPLLNCLDKGKGSVFLYIDHTKPTISLFALTRC